MEPVHNAHQWLPPCGNRTGSLLVRWSGCVSTSVYLPARDGDTVDNLPPSQAMPSKHPNQRWKQLTVQRKPSIMTVYDESLSSSSSSSSYSSSSAPSISAIAASYVGMGGSPSRSGLVSENVLALGVIGSSSGLSYPGGG